MSDGATRIPQRCWESKGILAEQMKHYLGHTCVEELPKYIGCGQEALEHKGGCGRGRGIPMGMWDSGMGHLGMQEFPWNFHGQISLSSQSGENSMDGSPPSPLPWEFHGEMIGIQGQSNDSGEMRSNPCCDSLGHKSQSFPQAGSVVPVAAPGECPLPAPSRARAFPSVFSALPGAGGH